MEFAQTEGYEKKIKKDQNKRSKQKSDLLSAQS
jgi:hypothetical protein